MAGTVIVPWYATGFRADALEEALNAVAASALRYGASSYAASIARAMTATASSSSRPSRITSTGNATGRDRR